MSAPFSYEAEDKIRLELILSLLSLSERPIKTRIKYQKELFLLTKSFPKFEAIFDFIPHKFGPYSLHAESILENYCDYFIEDSNGISLTEDGKNTGVQSRNEMKPQNRAVFEKVAKMIISLAESVTDDELMFLIYSTYGYDEHSDVYESLIKKKDVLSKRLLDKGLISHNKYQELVA